MASDIESTSTPDSPIKRVGKRIGWVALGFALLLLFTLWKLPEDKIKAFVHGTVASVLAEQGMSLSANESSLSIGFGVSYTLKDATLNLPPPQPPVRLEKIKVVPALLPMIFGKMGGRVLLQAGEGTLDASFSAKGSQLALSFDADKVDVRKLGVLQALAKISAGGVLTGTGSLSGDFAAPTSLEGAFKLDLQRVVVDAQSISGFSIPKLSISEAKFELDIDQGKAKIKTARVGKQGSEDDLQATATGDITLGKQIDASVLSVKSKFSFSQNVMKSFVLLDALLSSGKQPDGSYGFQLSGPLYSPTAMPLSAGQI